MSGSSALGGAARLPNLVDDETFRLLLHFEVHKAMRLRYCVGLVAVSIDARDGEIGIPAEVELTRHLAEIATGRLRATDVVTTLSPFCIGLLLIDAETTMLPRIVRRAAEHWSDGRVLAGGREWRVRWSAGGGCYPQTATTATGLLEQVRELMTRSQAEGSQQVHLPV